MEKLTIGIDPGQKGAIAIIQGQFCIDIKDMPLMPNHEVDANELYRYLNMPEHRGYRTAVIERSQPMPKQGVVSVFSYGRGYGAIVAVLQVLEIPFQEVPAMKWKKSFSLNRDKGESVTKALELFPSLKQTVFYTPRGRMLDGRAEALLIAEYGRRHL